MAEKRGGKTETKAGLPDGPMEVVATQPGVYGHLREEGERFTIRHAAKDFSARWMKPCASLPAERTEEDEDSKAGKGGGGVGSESVI